MALADAALERTIGIPGAVALGLGSILGSGVFVSIAIGAGIAGPAVVLAVVLAAVVATFNGLSSAALAASHPVSGGTYEYGYRYLNPLLGFTAGWMFLCAKSASAATAALGLAGYWFGFGNESGMTRIAALAVVGLTTALVAGGVTRSNRVNAIAVTVTLTALLALVAVALPLVWRHSAANFSPFLPAAGWTDVMHATALMFVAYTGYGRVATLGEEVRDPARTIPRAVIATLVVAMLLYVAVAAASVGVLGAAPLAQSARAGAAPLQRVAHAVGLPVWPIWLASFAAMYGVLLNLLLGLSRVVLAMARRADVPSALAAVDEKTSSPRRAVVATGVLIALLVLIGDVKSTWSFSAFTVLVYYALTNLAALRLSRQQRRFTAALPLAGLISCLSLAFWVEPAVWMSGLGFLAAGVLWFGLARQR